MEDRSFYVYAHYRLDTMEPFYIGKGRGNRKDIPGRNPIHDNISEKHGHAVVVLYDNLTEQEAFFYEREVIEDLVFNEGYEIHCKNCGEFTGKFSYLTNFSFGGEGVSGCNYSEETKKKISVVQRKRFEDEKEREKISIAIKKSYEDPKVREKLSLANKTSWKNPERRKRQSEKILGEKNGRIRSIYCNELNIVFSYIGLAEKYCTNVLNSKIGIISLVCNGKRNFTGRYNGIKLTWSWTENVDKEVLDKAEYIDSKKYEEIINGNKKYLKKPKIKKNLSERLFSELNHCAKSVYCNELNIIFSYIGLAEEYCINVLNSKIGPIRHVCNGKRKSSGKLADGTKLTWSWLEDVDQEILDKAEYIDSKKYEELLSKNVNDCK